MYQYVKLEGDVIMVRTVRYVTVLFVAILVYGAVAQPAHAQNQVHVVRRGETLFSIAARYGTTTQAIVRANGLPNANRIYVGQRLVIPGSGSSGAAGQTGSSGNEWIHLTLMYVTAHSPFSNSIANRSGQPMYFSARGVTLASSSSALRSSSASSVKPARIAAIT